MKQLYIILGLFLILFIPARTSWAQNLVTEKESTVTDESELAKYNDGSTPRDAPPQNIAHPCPYTCNDAGYSHGQCREWQDGDTCMIGPKLDTPQREDLTVAH